MPDFPPYKTPTWLGGDGCIWNRGLGRCLLHAFPTLMGILFLHILLCLSLWSWPATRQEADMALLSGLNTPAKEGLRGGEQRWRKIP